MSQPEWEGLEQEVRELARRVSRIEKELGIRAEVIPAAGVAAPIDAKPPGAETATAALLPLFGRALLGLAGAYLLRALTEAGTLPHRTGVGVGILYAVVWLLWAARTPAAQRLEAALHSLTSALVLAPLLWEALLRFHAISTTSAGSILLFFSLFGLAVSWRKNLLIVATIATVAGLGTAAALLVATHDVLPFTGVFLALAAAVEASACLDHWLSERWLAACAADLAVLLATWLVTNPRGLPPAYAPIPHSWLLAAQIALLAIYLASTIVRTLLRGAVFTNFEIIQCAAAFAIGVSGGLRLSHEDPRLGTATAILTIACGTACYAVSFLRLDREDGQHGRNFYTYSTFGILLMLAGSRILLSGEAADLLWPALAVACIWAGGHFARMTLRVHGAIYLILALTTSGAFIRSASLVLGSAGFPAEEDTALVTGLAAAAVCCFLALRGTADRAGWNFQSFRLAMVATFAWISAGAAAGLFTAAYHKLCGEFASHSYCATLRTTVVSAAALLLAWLGSRWNRQEFLRLIYPAMLLGAYRLLMLDLHQDQTPARFLSLLIYGAALIALPRLRKPAAKES